MFIQPGQPPLMYPQGGRGQLPGFPQGIPGAQGGRGQALPGGFPAQQGGRGVPNAQQLPPMYMPPGMAPGGFPAPYMSPQYLQLAQAAQQAALAGGRGGTSGRGPIPPMPLQPQMAVPGIRGGQGFPPQGGAGRGLPQARPGQAPLPGFPQGRAPGGIPGPVPGGLDIATLTSAPPGQQKQMLGEALYPKIHEMQPELAGKITGMLLEMDNTELINL